MKEFQYTLTITGFANGENENDIVCLISSKINIPVDLILTKPGIKCEVKEKSKIIPANVIPMKPN